MELRCETIRLRPWRAGDEAALVGHANNRRIWINLKDRFPHPYAPSDAEQWIRRALSGGEPTLDFAIVLGDEPIGGIGLERRSDVYVKTAEIGYWLGEEFWGRGFATEAVRVLVTYAFTRLDVERLEAGVFEWNAASRRVLEKAGFVLEARLRKSVFKDGKLIDRFLYARFRPASAGEGG